MFREVEQFISLHFQGLKFQPHCRRNSNQRARSGQKEPLPHTLAFLSPKPPQPGSQWDNLLRTESHRDDTTVGTSIPPTKLWPGWERMFTATGCIPVVLKVSCSLKHFKRWHGVWFSASLILHNTDFFSIRFRFTAGWICCPTKYFSVSAAAQGEGHGDSTVTQYQYHCHRLKISNPGRHTMRSCQSLSSSCSGPSVSYQQVV